MTILIDFLVCTTEFIYVTIKQEDEQDTFQTITTTCEAGGETEQYNHEGMNNRLSMALQP